METRSPKLKGLVVCSTVARICAWALASPASAARRAVTPAVSVTTEPRSRRLMAKNATAMNKVTDNKIRVMTSAMPRWEGRWPEARTAGLNRAAADFLKNGTRQPAIVYGLGNFMGRRRGPRWGWPRADGRCEPCWTVPSDIDCGAGPWDGIRRVATCDPPMSPAQFPLRQARRCCTW